MTPLARLSNVSKSYGSGARTVDVLRDVTLEIGAGEFVAITGPSGSGKSTLLHLLGCLDRASRGEVRFRGEDVAALDDERVSALRNAEIGFVFQSFHLIPRLTVVENVEVPLLYANVSLAEARERARRATGAVGLAAREAHRPTELSGGECQRAAIARAVVNEPVLLLADEPTGNLDAKTGAEVMEVFRGLNDAGTSVVVVTHNPAVAGFASRVLELRDGRLCG
jgi:putative ABC transport system ATP-binding protein